VVELHLCMIELLCLNAFCECMHICYLMEIIILTTEMLLTHGVENISGVVRHCNRKVASQVVT
jgi:hypothetical protein